MTAKPGDRLHLEVSPTDAKLPVGEAVSHIRPHAACTPNARLPHPTASSMVRRPNLESGFFASFRGSLHSSPFSLRCCIRMLESLASRFQTIVLVALVTLLCLVFVLQFGGPQAEGCTASGASFAAKVDGDTISAGDFNAAYILAGFNRRSSEEQRSQ